MSEEKVFYNGTWIHPSWPTKIEEAQRITTITLNGTDYQRIKYGDEKDDWGADIHPCGDCAAIKGQYHVPSCDIEECPNCGGQAIGCDCEYEGDEE
jgi:hypothetical protein